MHDFHIIVPMGSLKMTVPQTDRFPSESQQLFTFHCVIGPWLAKNGGSLPLTNQTINIDIEKYLLGDQARPSALENGLKDSIRIDPGEVVTIMVRFVPADNRAPYAFDPTNRPTYIWNSNIFDHEENEMMRQFIVVA